MNKKGFTLIELMVVVLIIGILAAIALPQYRKVVEKSKVAEAVITLKYMRERGHEFMLAHDTWEYPLTNEKLGIEFPSNWECMEDYGDGQEMCCSNEWCFENAGYSYGYGYGFDMPAAIRIKKGTTVDNIEEGFVYDIFYDPNGKLYCFGDSSYCKIIAKEESNGWWLM